ncbi:MAG: AMP-binding protein [Bacteroidetes bacterium]|nr:AMP-binding protein [Bacteroidota bacterium]
MSLSANSPDSSSAEYQDTVLSWTETDGSVCPWSWQAVHRPEGAALIDGSGQVETWLSLHKRANKWEEKLSNLPVGPVGVSSWNSAALVAFLIGAWRASKTVAILSPRLPYGQPQQLLKLLGGSLIELEAGTDLPDDSKLLGIDHAAAVLCGLGKASTLILTSGSSGDPRFVRHNAHAHIHSALASSKRLAILQQDRWLWSLPAFHAGGLAILWRMAVSGGSVMIQPRGRTLSDQLSLKSPTLMSLVPTQLRDLLDRNTLRPTALRDIIVGGAPLSISLLKLAVEAKWPVRTTYGLSETASMVTLSDRWTSEAVWSIPGEAQPNGPSPAGYPLEGAQVEVKEGRVRARGAMLAEAYLSLSAEANEDPIADSDGWFSTSDAGEFLGDGSIRLLHRLDRVIISGGENVDLAQIEMAIKQLPAVYQVIVIGVPDERFGERPVAFVDMHGVMPDAAWFNERLVGRLEKMAIPDRFLPWPDLPEGSIKPSHALLRRLAL